MMREREREGEGAFKGRKKGMVMLVNNFEKENL